jgi:hypothetical protein
MEGPGNLALRKDYEKARSLVLRKLQEKGPSTKSDFNYFVRWGISRTAIDLAIAGMVRDGTIEQLFTFSSDQGRKPTYYALPGAVLPSGVFRVQDALLLIGD